MKPFTVIGLYADTGQVVAEHVNGDDAEDAMRRMASQPGRIELQIVGAIEGQHQLTAPCEDSGKAAFAADLLTEAKP